MTACYSQHTVLSFCTYWGASQLMSTVDDPKYKKSHDGHNPMLQCRFAASAPHNPHMPIHWLVRSSFLHSAAAEAWHESKTLSKIWAAASHSAADLWHLQAGWYWKQNRCSQKLNLMTMQLMLSLLPRAYASSVSFLAARWGSYRAPCATSTLRQRLPAW